MPRYGSRARRRLPAAAVALAATALLLGGSTASHAAQAAHTAHTTAKPGPGFPAQYAAPYVETWNAPSAMTAVQSATGLKYFTLAFVLSDGSCNATFNGDDAVDDASWTGAINSLRAAGGDVIASFGGAAGTELAQACPDVPSLQAQYEQVIDTLNLTRIDLDIEGAALDDTDANDRRDQALANLQQQYAADGRTLDVDYTLPVNPNGLSANALSLLGNARSEGLNVNLVNIMTMDYGDSLDMGQAATGAASALHDQLGRIWSAKTSAQLWAMEGNTPMIGVNDATNEVFSADDATTLERFAAANGIQELSFWALGRDQACASTGTLSDACSGTAQRPYQFSGTFNAVTGAGGTGAAGTVNHPWQLPG